MKTIVDEIESTWDAATMLDALPERVNRYRVSDHVIVYCNAAWAAQYRVEPAQALGRPVDDFLSDHELEGLRSQLEVLGPDNPILVDSVARAVPDIPDQWLEWVDRYLVGPDGAEVLSIGRDVTTRYVAEIRLAESEARFRDLADKSVDIVWRLAERPARHFTYVSPSVLNILGYPPSYFLDDFNRVLDIMDDEGRAAIEDACSSGQVLERFDFRFRHANGSTVIAETQTTAVHDGFQGVSRDVTELRGLQSNLAALALRDPLTGLANRRLFDELLDAALARTERNGTPLALAFLDLDDLKHVNDNYGHEVGDLVLRETARRLVSVVRGSDIVARLGGDEFVVIYEPTGEDSGVLIERIDQALSEPFSISPDITVHCRASIGTADTRTLGFDPTHLLGAADQAMYEVKRARQSQNPAARR